MKRFLKVSIVLCLLCAVMSMTAFAGTVSFSKFNMKNTGRKWNSTESFNTKAEAGQPWFIKVTDISFGGASAAGTYGIAHAPGKYVGGSSVYEDEGNTYWTQYATSSFAYVGWRVGYGAANRDYVLLVRLDDLITGTSSAYTRGQWNSW